MNLSVEQGLAIGNGILTVDNADQAWARASISKKNKGRDAVLACLSIVKQKKVSTVTLDKHLKNKNGRLALVRLQD